jgi:pyrimidine deaminase RibD-like protein
MRAAMEQGRRALGISWPNPPVGCVLVRDLHIAARGYTNPPGGPHAEAMALLALDPGAGPVAAFVTLEPCSFYGRTPSCARALVARGVASVYVGVVDPHPRNRGAGLALLRDAGVEVEVGILGEVIARSLGPHLLRSG